MIDPMKFEEIDESTITTHIKSSLEKPPELELKSIPDRSWCKYKFDAFINIQ